MEQGGGISIISSPSVMDNNVGKVKSNGLTITANRFMNVKEKLRATWIKEDGTFKECVKKGLAEMIGTAILVFLGCLGCVGSLGNSPEFLQICLAFGFAVMIAITSVSHISGAHINPAVTVGAVVCGHKSLISALVYFIGQIIGGIIGYGLLKVITPLNFLHNGDPENAAKFCATLLHPRVSVMQGFACEVIATAVLVFMYCAVADKRNSSNTDSTPLKFGFLVAVLCFGFVPFTGASMNPARSFAPALFNNQWSHHWIFWLGPISGALVSSILYRVVFGLSDEDYGAGV